MPVTIADVARRAHVSESTVSRVINRAEGHMSEATRQRVLAAIEELGYRPSLLARSLRNQKTHTIGVVVDDIGNLFFPSVLRGIDTVAHARGYSLIVCNTDGDLDREREYLEMLRDKLVEGIIFAPTTNDGRHIDIPKRAGIPLVIVDNWLPGTPAEAVVVNNVRGAYMATEHLIKLGHRHIATIAGPQSGTSGVERLEGYLAALRDYGLDPDGQFIRVGDFRQQSGYDAARELLALPGRPPALFVANIMMTIGAVLAIGEAGLRIPQDIALVSFDDTPLSPILRTPLTAIAQPTERLGKTAAELLLRRIEHKGQRHRQRKTVLEPELIVRESCGARLARPIA